jgi:hypothetical protein
VRELRLALVCYGGVSLTIYMHGVTKEIHKLVRASMAFEHDPTHNPFADHETEHVYWDDLRAGLMTVNRVHGSGDGKVRSRNLGPHTFTSPAPMVS